MRRNLITRKPIRTLTVSPSGADFDSIQSAIDSALEDDLIIVYPGTYSERLFLKNGVDIFCFPGVTITSASEFGTITDDDNPVIMSLSGSPTIINTLDVSKRIHLLQASSCILDFQDTLFPTSNTLLHSQAVVFANSGDHELEITLPDAQYFLGKQFILIKIDSSGNAVIINTVSNQNILGQSTYSLGQQYGSITLVSDGTAWY